MTYARYNGPARVDRARMYLAECAPRRLGKRKPNFSAHFIGARHLKKATFYSVYRRSALCTKSRGNLSSFTRTYETPWA